MEIERRVIRTVCLNHPLQNCKWNLCCLLPCHTASAPSHPKAKTCQNVWDANASAALTSYLIRWLPLVKAVKKAHKAMKSFPAIKFAQYESLYFFIVFVVLYRKMSSVMLCCQLSSNEFVSLSFRTTNCLAACGRRWKQSCFTLQPFHRSGLTAGVGLPLSDSSKNQNQWVIQQVSCNEPQISQQAGEAPS